MLVGDAVRPERLHVPPALRRRGDVARPGSLQAQKGAGPDECICVFRAWSALFTEHMHALARSRRCHRHRLDR